MFEFHAGAIPDALFQLLNHHPGGPRDLRVDRPGSCQNVAYAHSANESDANRVAPCCSFEGFDHPKHIPRQHVDLYAYRRKRFVDASLFGAEGKILDRAPHSTLDFAFQLTRDRRSQLPAIARQYSIAARCAYADDPRVVSHLWSHQLPCPG